MAADPLDQVLRLVAEGRLTADEAAPILAALDERPAPAAAGAPGGRDPAAGPGRRGAGGFGQDERPAGLRLRAPHRPSTATVAPPRRCASRSARTGARS